MSPFWYTTDYNCTCAGGYKDIGEGRTGECEDINECDIPICDPAKSTCDNLPGTFECECFNGYVDVSELQDGTNCTNVNECVDGTHTCYDNSTCTDTTGGYKCACIEGYEDEPSQAGNASYVIGTECVDIDVCDPVCDFGFQCLNNAGSFTCVDVNNVKQLSTHLQGDFECVDIDKCKDKVDKTNVLTKRMCDIDERKDKVDECGD